MEQNPDNIALPGVSDISIPPTLDMLPSEAIVDSVEQTKPNVAPENAQGDGSEPSGLQSTSDTLASKMGSIPVPLAEQETELANPLDSSYNNTHVTASVTDSTFTPLMNEPEANPASLKESVDNGAGAGETQPSKSPVPATPIIDIQALLATFPSQTSEILSTTNVQTEIGQTSALIPSNVSTDSSIPKNDDKSQPSIPLGEISSLPTLMQSNQANNTSQPPTILAPMLTTGANGLPPPPSASFQQPLPNSIPLPAIPGVAAQSKSPGDEDGPFPPELEGPYEDFLRDERANLNEGNWEKFPDGSRLFIGNLPTEKVSKRDVFRRFCRYGKLAQISLKQAYGFVQFLDAESCARAKDSEQDSSIKGRKIHLEVSRPNRGGKDRNSRRRSRSPDFNRNRGDRYSGSGGGTRERDRDRDNRRNRDDYRPNRSPSPRGNRRGRSPDHYDGRRPSRSKSPLGDSRHHGRDDDIPLPHRDPRDVPDVQIIAVDDLNRDFIGYVESSIKKRGLRCDVLILSPRLSEDAVIRRQIVEGVLAVIRLSRINQATGKIPVKLFDRSRGADQVRFEDYENLDAQVAAEVIFRAKSTHAAPIQTYTPMIGASYGVPPPYGAAPAGSNVQGDLSALLAQLGSRPDAQSLLSALQAQGQVPNQSPTNLPPSVSQQLLANLGGQRPSGLDQASTGQSHMALASLLGSHSSMPQNSGIGGVPGSMPQGQNPRGQKPDIQEIMAQLAKYQR